MTTLQIYLDNNATTQPLPQVIEAMTEVMSARFGNPSSAHVRGDIAREVLAHARGAVADLLRVNDSAVTFTSGATEANNVAILSIVNRRPTLTTFRRPTLTRGSALLAADLSFSF